MTDYKNAGELKAALAKAVKDDTLNEFLDNLDPIMVNGNEIRATSLGVIAKAGGSDTTPLSEQEVKDSRYIVIYYGQIYAEVRAGNSLYLAHADTVGGTFDIKDNGVINTIEKGVNSLSRKFQLSANDQHLDAQLASVDLSQIRGGDTPAVDKDNIAIAAVASGVRLG